jgi:NhaA family Na+:H+ antiporter
VGFLIVPIFGFANAGVALGGMNWSLLLAPVTLGVAAGLFIGKQIGVFSAILITTSLRLTARPEGASWLQVYGVAILCGIGFTMSLFIGLLSFPSAHELETELKVGVLLGSLCSAILGSLVLLAASRGRKG